MSIYDSKYEIIYKEKVVDIKLGKIGTFIRLLYNAYNIKKLLEKIDFDFIYMRYMRYMPFFNRILKTNIIIMEINSDDSLEYKLRSKFRYFYNLLTRDLVLKEVNAFVSVSEELKDRFKKYNQPTIVIGNGINTKNYNLIETNNPNPILVFIGSPNQAWHGVDKIQKMAEYFIKYQFYIIGTNGVNTDNLKYFGYLSQEESTKLINKADIGIGTLSLYSKGLTEASPLKSRQYLACGLPLVYAYDDTDISDNSSFVLKLENTENNLNFEKIEKFIQKVFKNKTINLESRNFAENVLDYKVKEIVRVDFFQDIINMGD